MPKNITKSNKSRNMESMRETTLFLCFRLSGILCTICINKMNYRQNQGYFCCKTLHSSNISHNLIVSVEIFNRIINELTVENRVGLLQELLKECICIVVVFPIFYCFHKAAKDLGINKKKLKDEELKWNKKDD